MSGQSASRVRRARGAILGTAALALFPASVLGAAPALAQDQPSGQSIAFNIPAGSVSESLRTYAGIAGLQLIYNADLDTAGSSPGVSGTMSARDALSRLLTGTGLTFRFVNATTVTIESANASGERVTGAVRVEGLQGSPYFGGAGQMAGVNGINGSRDITATEGTKSFTSGALTIGSKIPQALKDVPQSVSVLTSERMQQQNVADFTTAMRQLPGITLVQGNTSLENSFLSRGFSITSIQVDGGAPINGAANGFFPQIDMSMYDHVELLRGAFGLFNGYGSPGGTVNLVRKKPLDHNQVSLEGQAGSWNNYRVVADATGPLALDGRLRGRAVITWQDREYFYDLVRDDKTLLYGILDFDLSSRTLLKVGASHTRQNSLPWYGGLPRYQTGEDLKLPRSTALAFPWNRWDFRTTEIFGGIEQKIGEQWALKVDFTRTTQESTRKVGRNFSNGTVNPLNGTGPRIDGTYDHYASNQWSTDLLLSGAFEIFGQRQEVTIGANHIDSDSGGGATYNSLFPSSYLAPYQPYPGGPQFCYSTSVLRPCPVGTVPSPTPPIDVFNFDPNDPNFTEPQNPLRQYYYPTLGAAQNGAYVNLRLTAFDRFHLTTGVRWSSYKNNYAFDYLCVEPTQSDCAGKQMGDVAYSVKRPFKDSSFTWPPAVAISYDVTKNLTGHIGYTDIYQSQANYVDVNHKPLAPVTGENIELGLKWAARGGRLNVAAAAYRMRRKGEQSMDFSEAYQEIGPGIYCCFIADYSQSYQSTGFDIDVTGELAGGLQIASSYGFNDNKRRGSSFGTSEGLPFSSIFPKHVYKLWLSYDLGAAGHAGALSRLAVAGGINGQSAGYYSGSVCVNLQSPDPLTGTSRCVSSGEPDTVPYKFTAPAYAVVSARIDYRLSDTWEMAVNLENIFDKRYYQTVGPRPTGGNWYGAPRSFMATLRGKW